MARSIEPLKRIALVTDWYLPRLGGVEWHVADLAAALRARGLETSVLTTTPAGQEAKPESPDIQRIASARAPGFGFSISPRLVGKMTDRLRDGRFDLVHAHASVISPLALASLLAARRLGLPAVVTFHSMLLRGATVLRWADRAWDISSSPIVFTAVSRVVADQVQSALPVEALTLTNGIDLSAWPAKAPAPPAGERKIIFATAMRLTAKKRPVALLDAFQTARKIASARDRELELRVAGDGPMRGKMEAVIRRAGLADHVRLLGALSRPELRALYAQSDVFVLPSSLESFGIAPLEARASGLPVAAMANTGTSEFLEDRATALLASDDRLLAANMARLATDDELRGRLSGRDPGLARFDWPEVVKRHVEVYERAAGLMGG